MDLKPEKNRLRNRRKIHSDGYSNHWQANLKEHLMEIKDFAALNKVAERLSLG